MIAPVTARFWVWHRDSWVKLTLRPGQSLSAATFSRGRDGEGHSFTRDAWTHRGPDVLNEWQNGGRDCDGPISREGAHACPLGRLQSDPACSDSPDSHHAGRLILRPEWEKAGEVTVIDVYAQAANY